MKRAIISTCAALVLLAGLTTPAHADVTERYKQDTGTGCGPDNDQRSNSWVDLDDKNTSTLADDKIAYNANGAGAIGDLRVDLWNQSQVYDIAVEIRKLNSAGTGYVVHYSAGRSFGTADPAEDFEFASVSDIDRSRKPYLWVP